jgi:hypothetical protein
LEDVWNKFFASLLSLYRSPELRLPSLLFGTLSLPNTWMFKVACKISKLLVRLTLLMKEAGKFDCS